MLPTIFNFGSQQLRTIVKDGEPWFVASDVCKILEIGNPSDAVRRLDPDEVTLVSIEGASNGLPVNAVNESGLYSLVLGSRKPEAKQFKRWITHEVIPSIRKTGSYSVQPLSPTEALLKSVQLLAEQERQIKELTEYQAQQSQQLNVLTERVTNLDLVNIDGDLQQRLNSMIRKYARDEGINYSRAWGKFIRDYNTAFRTNLTASKNNYQEKRGKTFTTPGYLNEIGKLEDAVRVADKMLNQRVS